jgi:acyl-coenzyme A synthetase/AMP-(fatty) acid ligase/acetyltransferase-like isoleucine patch superfamily enzyme
MGHRLSEPPYGHRGIVVELPEEKTLLFHHLETMASKISVREPKQAAAPESLLYISFTSGSTGFPKAVLGEHAPVTHFLSWQRQRFCLDASDRVSMLSGLGHDPLLRDVFLPLSIGATVCIPPRECFTTPHFLFEWMRKERITVSHLTPSVAKVLLSGLPQNGGARLESLKYAFFGGEPLRHSLVRRFKDWAPNATVVNCYGTTETPQVASYHIVNQDEIQESDGGHKIPESVPVGRGIDGVQLLIQRQDGQLCDEGELGEICVRSSYLAREVWDETGRPIPVIKANPHRNDPADFMYPTGDLGYYLANGEVVCAGRRDKQIKIRGHRIQLEEIEKFLDLAAGILSYYVDAQPNSGFGHDLVLYLVPAQGKEIDISALKLSLTDELPDYMVPDRFVVVPSLPVTPNGKIDVEALRLARSSPNPARSIGEPSDESSLLLRLCATELGLSLSYDDDLFEVGLNSLQSISLCCAIEEQFGVVLSARDLSECGTPRRLAEHISELCSSNGTSPASDREEAAPVQSPLRTEENAVPLALKETRVRLGLRPLPKHENPLIGIRNRLLQIIARLAPDFVRVKCHKWRGVTLGRNVSIGYDSIIETAFPWLVKIGDDVNIGMRVTIIAHLRDTKGSEMGVATVDIDDLAFIGPGVIVLPNVKVGRGAVVTAGSIVSSSIPPFVLAHGNPAVPIARCGLPLSGNTTYNEFIRNLQPYQPGAVASGLWKRWSADPNLSKEEQHGHNQRVDSRAQRTHKESGGNR